MIYLEHVHCSHPYHAEPGIALVYSAAGHARRISGCGEAGARGTRISHRGLPAKLRYTLQSTVAALIVGGAVEKSEGERFLDEVYAESIDIVVVAEGQKARRAQGDLHVD